MYASHPAALRRQNDSVGVGRCSLTIGNMGRARVPARRFVASGRRLVDSTWRPCSRVRYRRHMRYLFAVCLLASNVCLAQTRPAAQPAGTPADQEAVRRAATDYLEGFYEGDTA